MEQLWPSILLLSANFVTPTICAPYTWVLSDFFYEKLFMKVVITDNFTVWVCSFDHFCWKKWPRAWWFSGPGLGDSVAQGLMIQQPRAWWFSGPGFGDSVALGLVIQDSNWVCCWDGAWHQQLQNLHLIIPFQYVLRCQLMFTCLNILPCWFDNSCYLIGSQKPTRQLPGDQRESSTNMQKNYSCMRN